VCARVRPVDRRNGDHRYRDLSSTSRNIIINSKMLNYRVIYELLRVILRHVLNIISPGRRRTTARGDERTETASGGVDDVRACDPGARDT